MRRLLTWSIVVLVGGIGAAAIVAAIVNDDTASQRTVAPTQTAGDVSPCSVNDLELSIRASGFGAHVAALRLPDGLRCDVGNLRVAVTVLDRKERRIPTEVAPPQEFTGNLHPGEELIATFDYTMKCRDKERGPFTATVTAAGEIGSLRATSPVAFRRDPFATASCSL